MKILIIHNTQADLDSGAAGTEYQTGLHLQQAGHKVDHLWADDLVGPRLKNGRLDQVFLAAIRMRQAVRARLAEQSYDVIHVNQPYGFLVAMDPICQRQAVVVNRSQGLEPRRVENEWPVARQHIRWTTRFHPIWGPLRWLLNYLDAVYLRFAVQHSDGVIVSCSEDRDWLLQRQHIPQEKVRVIPMAPASCFFTTPLSQREPENRWRNLCYVAWTGAVKGLYTILTALDILVKSGVDFHLRWVTHATAHERLRHELPSARVVQRVTFLDWMPQTELVQILDECGIFLYPSLFEGFGKAALEAMARGLCVIASNVGGMHDVIRNGQDGILIPPNDAQALAEAIVEILADPERARRIGVVARERAKEFTWDRVARETIAFYQELAQRKWSA